MDRKAQSASACGKGVRFSDGESTMMELFKLHARLIKLPIVALGEIREEMTPFSSFLVYTFFLIFNLMFWLTPLDLFASIIQTRGQAVFASLLIVLFLLLAMFIPWLVHWLIIPYLLPASGNITDPHERRVFYRTMVSASTLPHVIYAFLILMPVKLVVLASLVVPGLGFVYPYLFWINRILTVWTIITIAGVYIIRWNGLYRSLGYSKWQTALFVLICPLGLALCFRVAGIPFGFVY
ncbi:MAG: hypothetical protein GXO70_10540 [Acidobacteria bacterium]|nr:hypothetical protein [Acidobacteriota bacterium]